MRQGGWLYKCGHFHPSDFMQIAQCQSECFDCIYAKELLAQAKQLRKSKKSAAPVWSVNSKYRKEDQIPMKRIPDCQMSY